MSGTVSRKDFLRLGGVGLVSATLLGVAGCGRRLGGNRDVVKFLTGTEETTIQERAVTEIQVNRFEEQHPKYTLEREAIDPDAMSKVIQSRLRSDESPDVFSFDTGPGFGGVLADTGVVHPLERTYNGTVYGVPDQVEEIIVFYNKDLMPEEPQTLEELRRVAEEHKLRGTIPLAFGNREQYPAGHLFSMGASNLLGRQGLDDILYGNGRWDVPEVVRAIDLFFRDFVESGYYPRNVNAVTFDEASTLFYSGEAAMLPTGTWLVSEIVQAVQDFEVGFFPFPSIDGSGISPPAGLGAGLFVAEEASNLQGAIEFIDYLLQDSTARLIIEKLNVIPAQPVNPKGLDVPELFKEVLEDLSASPEAKSFGYNIDVLAPQNFNDVMFTGFEEVLAGTRSPAEQSAALQDAWATAKKQGKIATQD